MAKNNRNQKSQHIQDVGAIENLTYNQLAGSKKVSEVGRNLIPLGDGAAGFTTNASTAKVLPGMGKNLAIYNNGTIASVTLGTSSAVTSLAVGATDANGNVGIPLKPNDWTYIACGEKNWVITSNASALVYIINDYTYIAQEAATYKGN